MNFVIEAALLAVGFVLLIKGADFFVDGSSAVARRLKVPTIIIGLTIVAMGTSLPECAVSITASLADNNALAVSNAVGSNIFNLMVVCGFCAFFNPLHVEKVTLKREYPFSMICVLLLLGLGAWGMSLNRMDGIIFLALFLCFLIWMVMSALKSRTGGILVEDGSEEIAAEEEQAELLPVFKCLLYIVGGAAAIKLGGDFVVDAASQIALGFGLSQNLVGLTIVAMGTSLPELVTSVVAARKNELDMALGNIIGSNVFNVLFVLGVAAVISPIAFVMENVVDIILLTAMSALVWIFAWTKYKIEKAEGIACLACYAAYMVYICVR